MPSEGNKNFVDSLIRSALSIEGHELKLRHLFNQKLLETRISLNQAAVNMEIDNKQLEKILDGSITQFDTLALIKLSRFLDIPLVALAEMYFSMVTYKYQNQLSLSQRNSYILNTFDLPILKKIKFIDTIRDMDEINNRVIHFFNLSSVEEYKNEIITVAYSSGARKSKSGFAKSFWLRTAQSLLAGIENPYKYEREALVDYIPLIRWHTTDCDFGLYQVVRSLFKLGVTVVYVPTVSDAHVRGATIPHKSKPCIIITDYTDFYPTLFFVLLHELFHVLFDWEEILVNNYHISNEDNYYTENERDANDFAREFFASEEDLQIFSSMNSDEVFVQQFADRNRLHKSFYYLFNAYAQSKTDPKIWGRVRKYIPSAKIALEPLVPFHWNTRLSVKELTHTINTKIYNL